MIVIPSTTYRSPFVQMCVNEFQKITQDHLTLANHALVDDGGKKYLLV